MHRRDGRGLMARTHSTEQSQHSEYSTLYALKNNPKDKADREMKALVSS
jgi:hypothetical protein